MTLVVTIPLEHYLILCLAGLALCLLVMLSNALFFRAREKLDAYRAKYGFDNDIEKMFMKKNVDKRIANIRKHFETRQRAKLPKQLGETSWQYFKRRMQA